jgi:hypothetical protein
MRYTSARTAKELRATFPEAVEIPVPAGGWLGALKPMHDWAMARTQSDGFGALRYAVIGRLDGDAKRDLAQFCFRGSRDADAFQAQFGGTRLQPPPKVEKKGRRSDYRPTYPLPRPEPRVDFNDDV